MPVKPGSRCPDQLLRLNAQPRILVSSSIVKSVVLCTGSIGTLPTGNYGSYQWNYDADGNRLTQTTGTVTTGYTYSSGNDLLKSMSVNGTATQMFGYTAEGQLDSLNPGVSSPVDTRITALGYN